MRGEQPERAAVTGIGGRRGGRAPAGSGLGRCPPGSRNSCGVSPGHVPATGPVPRAAPRHKPRAGWSLGRGVLREPAGDRGARCWSQRRWIASPPRSTTSAWWARAGSIRRARRDHPPPRCSISARPRGRCAPGAGHPSAPAVAIFQPSGSMRSQVRLRTDHAPVMAACTACSLRRSAASSPAGHVTWRWLLTQPPRATDRIA